MLGEKQFAFYYNCKQQSMLEIETYLKIQQTDLSPEYSS